MKRVVTISLVLVCLTQAVVWFSCGGYKVPPNLTAEERFDLGKRMFANRDYVDSKGQFKILTLNYPGIKFMDEAQFLLAESHFNMKEYILASDEYNRLVRLYPNSQWVDDSQFKIGVCDYRLSPKPALDQKYTFQAIQSLQRFIEEFPSSQLVPEAEKLLNVSRGKIAKKEFKTGDLYRKLKDPAAALVYYNSVLAVYYDTQYAEGALFWKGQCLLKLERHEASLGAFEEFVKKYPESRMRSEALSKIKDIRNQLRQAQNANGDS